MKTEPENREQRDTPELLSPNPDCVGPDSLTDQTTEISVGEKIDLVSNPNYPSYEVLLDVADKVLKRFEKADISE